MSCGRDTKIAIFECPDSSHLISQEEGAHCDFQLVEDRTGCDHAAAFPTFQHLKSEAQSNMEMTPALLFNYPYSYGKPHTLHAAVRAIQKGPTNDRTDQRGLGLMVTIERHQTSLYSDGNGNSTMSRTGMCFGLKNLEQRSLGGHAEAQSHGSSTSIRLNRDH